MSQNILKLIRLPSLGFLTQFCLSQFLKTTRNLIIEAEEYFLLWSLKWKEGYLSPFWFNGNYLWVKPLLNFSAKPHWLKTSRPRRFLPYGIILKKNPIHPFLRMFSKLLNLRKKFFFEDSAICLNRYLVFLEELGRRAQSPVLKNILKI